MIVIPCFLRFHWYSLVWIGCESMYLSLSLVKFCLHMVVIPCFFLLHWCCFVWIWLLFRASFFFIGVVLSAYGCYSVLLSSSLVLFCLNMVVIPCFFLLHWWNFVWIWLLFRASFFFICVVLSEYGCYSVLLSSSCVLFCLNMGVISCFLFIGVLQFCLSIVVIPRFSRFHWCNLVWIWLWFQIFVVLIVVLL